MRAYAPFFEWFDKGQKELGIVEEMLISLKSAGFADLREPRLNHPDPPDCVCENRLGDRVAVEVAEVVCERAAHLTAKGNDVVRIWRDGELRIHIERLLSQKDRKRYHGGPYSELVVCLFTDEPMLTLEQTASDLSGSNFGPFSQLTSGFLLLSYNPSTKSYPAFSLPFDA